jgi:hypothetical protein
MRHPEYRAKETRVIAQAVVDQRSRDDLLKCAIEYEDLARQATVQQSEALANKVTSGRPVYVSR